MSEKKEKIVVLIVLLFILSYLIIWDYDKLIREPREASEKERKVQMLRYLQSEQHEPWIVWEGVKIRTDVEITDESKEELILDTSANNGCITFGDYSDAITIGSISILNDEGIVGWNFELDIYKLPWIWQDLDRDQTMIMMSSETAQKVHIAEEFMEWLYRNDYEIVKREEK